MSADPVMRTDNVLCLNSRGFHRMEYYDWGDPGNPRILICVHGLTRNGRDFDFLAQSLADDFHVICPDVAGRGKSDWLENKADYTYLQYMADMTALIARVTGGGAEKEVNWLGTSMGGFIGMFFAALPRNPLHKLVLNDAGLLVPKSALARLADYVGKNPRFASLEALEAHIRAVSAPFGPLTDEQWRHITIHSAGEHPKGGWGLRYDPDIAAPLRGQLKDIDLSTYWEAVKCPTLLIRGAESDLLLRETALAMTWRGPKAKLVEIPGVGHTPMLMDDEQVRLVRDFLVVPAPR
jgi:pimeloyl-ACP methyl ester carboxylesterase